MRIVWCSKKSRIASRGFTKWTLGWGGGGRWSSIILINFIPCFKAKVRPSMYQLRDQSLKIYTYLYTGVWKSIYLYTSWQKMWPSLYQMAEIKTHPYTKWQKSRPIPIPELKNCDPPKRHLRTRHFLGVNPPGTAWEQTRWCSELSWECCWRMLDLKENEKFIVCAQQAFRSSCDISRDGSWAVQQRWVYSLNYTSILATEKAVQIDGYFVWTGLLGLVC